MWTTACTSWANLYAGFPRVIHHDSVTELVNSVFQQKCRENWVILRVALVGSHRSMITFEKWHDPLRTIFLKLHISARNSRSHVILSMTIEAMNDTMGFDGLVPVFLVYGEYPRLPSEESIQRKTPMPNNRERSHHMPASPRHVRRNSCQESHKLAIRNKSPHPAQPVQTGDPVLVFARHNTRKNHLYGQVDMVSNP